jgi:gliding motility-associated-like protein
MKPNWLRLVATFFALFSLLNKNFAQGFSFNCARDTVLPGCPPNLCFTLKTLIPNPDRQASTYTVGSPSLSPTCLLASNNPGIPGQPTTLNVDDRYSPVFPIGFPFVFFGTPYNDLVVSSNGFLSFNTALTATFAHWNIINGGTPQDLPSTFYDEAIIMGPYHDIDVGITSSPNRLISYQTSGLAPYRKWILNYYKIPLFSGACNSMFENTHQIILYESTGIIDINIFDKQICPTWNQGRSMVGVQNFAQNVGVMAPGRRASDPPWGSIGMNESWRFVPSGGTPLFRRVELYTLGGTLVSTGTTVVTAGGDRDVSFPNICPPAGGATSYVIKAFYDKIDDPATEIFATDTIVVNRSNPLAATPVPNPAACGQSTGTITVNNVSGGTAPYEYSIDGVNWFPSNVFSNLPGGNYTVYVRDQPNTCAASYPVTVGVVSNLSAVANNTPTSCTGINNGTITITSSMGVPPFAFSIDGGTFVVGTLPYTFTNLPPGNHNVVVRDVNNCTTNPININITTGTGINSPTITTNPTSCAGANNGVITVTTVTGGTAPYEYQLNSGPFQPSNVFTGLPSGSYSITIRDAVGCTRTVTRTVNSGSSVTSTRVLTGTSCPTAADGAITITPTNGSGPYEFAIDGGPFVAGAVPFTFSGLTAGAHSFVIRDVPTNCLSFVINFTISSGPGVNGNAVQAATSCSGASNGTITVTPTSGTGPWEFSLDGAPYVAGASPYIFTNVPAGAHAVTIRNGSGCASNVINVTVVAGPSLVTTASKTDVLCNATPTGTITVTQPTVGTAPFEYSLDGTNWQTTNTFTNLAAGIYTVYYKEANGCQNTLSITVDEPTPLVASSAMVPVVCNGQSNGTVTVAANGGVGPYEYSADGGVTWQPSNVFNLPAGSYSVLVRDFNGCQRPQTVVVTEPVALTASSLNSNASCNGGNDGTIVISAAGGNAGFTYSIDGINFQSLNQFNVAPGSYTVTVKDNLGCTTTFPATVALTDDLTYTKQTDPVICESKSTQLNFASNATQYSWAPATALSSTTVANPVANPVVSTQYIVTATYGRCSVADTVMVNVNAAPVPDAGADGFICYGQTYQLNPSGGVQYKWTPSTYLSNSNIANPISTPGKDVVYTVAILADANGCASLVTDSMRIDVTPPIKIRTFPFDTVVYEYDTLPILAIASDTDVINYSWSPAFGLNNASINNPIVTAGSLSPALGTGTFGNETLYTVTGSTIAGCKGEGYVKVRIYKGPDLYVPSGFTPNGDGKNDRLLPFPVGIKELRYFRVYNRYGQLVFSTNKLHDGWDGTLTGIAQQTASFVWMAEAVTETNKVITKKGVVTLIR